jgi:hypothetical protein
MCASEMARPTALAIPGTALQGYLSIVRLLGLLGLLLRSGLLGFLNF